MKFSTRAIHAAQPCDPQTGAVTTPLILSSTFQQDEPGRHRGYDYGRTNNPTRRRLEAVLAELEGGADAAAFASGLAAEHAVLAALLGPGDEVLIPPDVYGGTHRLLSRVLARSGVRATVCDFAEPGALEQAIGDQTRLVWLESPTNPRLLTYDIARIARVTQQRGVKLAVDNTFATPVLQQPLALGADIVIHSATKYLAGHSDVVLGAVVARDVATLEPIRFLQNACGGVPAPFDCWLALRGIKTLELRVQRHCLNASRIAQALLEQPAVSRVYYPGLPTHPGHEIAKRQMADFGGMLSIEIDADAGAVCEFVSRRRLFALGESLGGVRSLICHPASMTHASIPPDARKALGLSERLVRLSPGIEAAEDLIDDLLEGLRSLPPRDSRVPSPSARRLVSCSEPE